MEAKRHSQKLIWEQEHREQFINLLKMYQGDWRLHCAWKEMDPPRGRLNFERNFKKIVDEVMEKPKTPHAEMIRNSWNIDTIRQAMIIKNDGFDPVPR